MTNRRRTRAAKSYTAKLYRHRTAIRPNRRRPAWLRLRWLPAGAMLCAEAGHLAAAILEWPNSTARGVVHVCAAAILGLVAVAVYFGPSKLDLGIGVATTLLLPALWPIGALAGASPYQAYPMLASIVLALVELAAAALLVTHWPAAAAPTPPNQRRPASARRAPEPNVHNG